MDLKFIIFVVKLSNLIPRKNFPPHSSILTYIIHVCFTDIEITIQGGHMCKQYIMYYHYIVNIAMNHLILAPQCYPKAISMIERGQVPIKVTNGCSH